MLGQSLDHRLDVVPMQPLKRQPDAAVQLGADFDRHAVAQDIAQSQVNQLELLDLTDLSLSDQAGLKQRVDRGQQGVDFETPSNFKTA